MHFSFKNFLVEEEKTVYFTFGRMNPPTIGHGKLIGKLARSAGKNPYRIYLSQTNDQDRNPLNYMSKIKYARKMFPKYARQIMVNKSVKNVMDVGTALYNDGFKRIVMVVGSDRVAEFEARLNAVNGKKGRHGFFKFQSITIVSAGERDPDAEGAKGMSGTKLRKAVIDNDFTTFSQGLPKVVSNADAKAIYNDVRKGMGLKEEKEFKNKIQLEPVNEIRESYVNGELFKTGDQVVIKESGEIGTVKTLGSNYVIVEGSGNQYRKWLDAVELVEEKPTYVDGNMKESLNEDYYKGLSKSTADKRKAHFKKHGDKPDDQKSAYKPAPGDATAKTKPSKHTLKFKQMFGENEMQAIAKKRIEREKQVDKIKHDRMLDRARTRDTQAKNKETK